LSAQVQTVSATARGLRLGRAALDAGAGGLLARLRLGDDPEPPGARSARILMQALVDLRGAALKIAQFLSLESDLLPEAAVRELSRSCHRVPPMGSEFARARVHAELGPIEKRFASFDAVPFAAASLGQVHAATTHDGRAVAVKVQYPGMSATIRSDLRLLRRAANMLPQRAHYRRLLDELESRLLEECDYALEAEALAWFRKRLAADVTVAEPLPSLSTSLVLCTVRLPGLHVDDWMLTEPSATVRDAAAQCLYDAFVESLHVLGRLHADPNPGNVLFDAEGRVGLLDFGCTRWVAPDYQALVRRIWRAAISGDEAAVHDVYLDMGTFSQLSRDQVSAFERELLMPFLAWLAIPFRSRRFDFGRQPDFIAEGRTLFARMLRHDALVGIRPEFMLVNRTVYGLYRLFERLRARVRCQTAWTSP